MRILTDIRIFSYMFVVNESDYKKSFEIQKQYINYDKISLVNKEDKERNSFPEYIMNFMGSDQV